MSTIRKTQRALFAGVLGATAVIGCSRDRNDDRLGPEDFREPYDLPAGKPVDDPTLDPLYEGADPAIGADERASDPVGEGAQGALVEPDAVQGIDSTQRMERGGYGIVSVAGSDATGEETATAAGEHVARPGVTTIIRGDGSDPIVLGGVVGGGAAGGVARGTGEGAINEVGGTGADPSRGSTAARDWSGGDVGDDVAGATDTDDDNFGEPAPRGMPTTTERDRSGPAAGRVFDRGAAAGPVAGTAGGPARSRATTGGGATGTTTGGATGTTTGGATGTTTGAVTGTTTGGASGTTAAR